MIKWYLNKLKKFYKQPIKEMILPVGMGIMFIVGILGHFFGIRYSIREKKKPKIRLID